MTNRPPCIAEQWFVRDGLSSLDGLCARCRGAFEIELRFFAATNEAAFHEVYRQSRAIRISAKPADARKMDDWEAIRVMRTLQAMVGLGVAVLADQKPHLFATGETDGKKA